MYCAMSLDIALYHWSIFKACYWKESWFSEVGVNLSHFLPLTKAWRAKAAVSLILTNLYVFSLFFVSQSYDFNKSMESLGAHPRLGHYTCFGGSSEICFKDFLNSWLGCSSQRLASPLVSGQVWLPQTWCYWWWYSVATWFAWTVQRQQCSINSFCFSMEPKLTSLVYTKFLVPQHIPSRVIVSSLLGRENPSPEHKWNSRPDRKFAKNKTKGRRFYHSVIFHINVLTNFLPIFFCCTYLCMTCLSNSF